MRSPTLSPGAIRTPLPLLTTYLQCTRDSRIAALVQAGAEY
ncbi:hypothetical protein [Amycolatopsis taiwanensis]|nr:hypothetical protein [Amycolatopsis taiwanensis]